jgi:predicted nucleotidyltransferase
MLTQLRKRLSSEKKDKNILDIILYGSSTRSGQKYNDIDIAVIFNSGTLKERLEKIHIVKEKLNMINIDIKAFLITDLFDKTQFARTGILLEGISLIDGKKFSEKLGLKPYTIFFYTLEGLTHTEKVKFNYLLSGRTVKGVIAQLDGKRLLNGCIKIPIENTELFKKILDKNKIQYSYEKMLVEE